MTADRVVIGGGRGALVRILPHDGVQANTTVYLVTDAGWKYALPPAAAGTGNASPAGTTQQGAQALLGYGSVTPVPIEAGLLDLLPDGPPLDPAAAQHWAPNPNASTSPTAGPSVTPST
jgi:hypothetical protein